MAMGGGMTYVINDRSFTPRRVDQSVRIGAIEEWTLVNSTMMEHPFHPHVWPMRLVDGVGIDA
jgi:FtsP/CotA-like multicopper oxidase with cupredoxin domain